MNTNTNFCQVCVWPGTIVKNDDIAEFESAMNMIFGIRVKFLECIYTYPDFVNGEPVPDTGGRCDTFFSIHNDDISKFFVTQRIQNGIRWIEDVYGNGNGYLYPDRIKEYMTWGV
jgi:hypothetical protein